MMLAAAVSLLIQTITPAEARRPPDEPVQTHGQNAVVKHDPAGAKIDIVAEEVGKCPGPGPTTIMRLRSADKERSIVAEVAKSVTVNGAVTVTHSSYTIAPMAAVDLGCLAQPGARGGRPIVNDWKIVSSRAH